MWVWFVATFAFPRCGFCSCGHVWLHIAEGTAGAASWSVVVWEACMKLVMFSCRPVLCLVRFDGGLLLLTSWSLPSAGLHGLPILSGVAVSVMMPHGQVGLGWRSAMMTTVPSRCCQWSCSSLIGPGLSESKMYQCPLVFRRQRACW